MKSVKKVFVSMLALVMILSVFFVTDTKVEAASNPYPEWQTVGGVSTIPCTRYAWQQTYERMGVALPAWGNAINWYYNAPNYGYSVGSVPKANSIAVWSIDSHSYGHVAFVTSVNGSQMTVNEGGRTDRTDTGGIVNGVVVPSTVGTSYRGRNLIGFIYIGWEYENLGDDFYAQISYTASGHGLCEVNGNVELGTANTKASYWRFIRQGDGSYKIYSTTTGGLLDVTGANTQNGTNIQVCPGDSGSRAQNWYILKCEGGYNLLSGLCYKALDITSGSVSIGANAQLYTVDGTSAQIFKISKECAHSYKSTVTKQPSCTSTGTKTNTCTICGHSYTANVNAQGHNYSGGKCTRCGDKPVGVKINRQPVSVSVSNGETAKVSVNATGSGLTYKWYYKNAGQSKFSQSVFKNNYYSVTMDSSSNGRQIYCVVTDKYGNSVKSNTVTLFISTFPDVPGTLWCYDAVEYVAEKGYITGYKQSGNFGPADKITRQDFVVVLAKFSGVDLKKYSGRTGFPDVKAGSYYEAAVKWASSTGIVNGYNNGKFGVNDPITREQLVAILYNYAKKTGCDMSVPASAKAKLNNYTDAYKITGYAKTAVIWALHNGVISGMTSTTIAPQNTASRGQAATIIMTFSKKFYE